MHTRAALLSLTAAAVAAVAIVAPLAEAEPEELPGVTGHVWVTNRNLNNVAVFEAATGRVLATIPVGREPNSLTAPAGTRKVYVSNEADGTVSVVSKDTLAVVRTISTGAGPHHIQSSPSGKLVAFGEFFTNRVGVIDTDTDAFRDFPTSSNPAARTHAPWFGPDGRTVHVTNEVANEIAALDALTGQVLWSLPVGNRPSEILVRPDGLVAYVSVRNENMIRVVDLTARRIVAESAVGTQPDTLQLTPDGRTLVVGLRGTPAQAAFMDTQTLAVRHVGIAGTTTGHEWLTPDSRFTFIAIEGPASIAVIDNAALKVVATWPYPAGGRPHGLVYDPADREGERARSR